MKCREAGHLVLRSAGSWPPGLQNMHCNQQFICSVVRASLERSVLRDSTWSIQHGGHSAWTDDQSHSFSRHQKHRGRKEHRRCWKRLEANLSGQPGPSIPTACPSPFSRCDKCGLGLHCQAFLVCLPHETTYSDRFLFSQVTYTMSS